VLVLVGILLGAAVALVWPSFVGSLKPLLQPAFAVTMFFVGTLVDPLHVRKLTRSPARPLVGLAAQYSIMPLLAWLVSLAFDDPALRVGIVLVGCVPGAMASNVMSVLFAADVALSVALTSLATLVCPLVLALWLPLLADARVEVGVSSLVWNTTWMVVLPAAVGVAVRWFKGELPRWALNTATAIAALCIVLIVMVVAALNQPRLVSSGAAVGLAMLALNLGGYALAFGVATSLGWDPPARRTLVIEVGMQNAGLGSVLATQHLGDRAALPAAFYTVLCVLTTALALPVLRRRSRGPRRSSKPPSAREPTS
jgi:BASS family bile acid:Na+ symporter